MPIEHLTADRPSLDVLLGALDLVGSAPDGLAAIVSWDDEGEARAVLVWDEAGADRAEATADGVRRTELAATHVHVRPPAPDEASGLVPTAFLDVVVAPTPLADQVRELAGLDDPPETLVAHVEWVSAPGETTALMLWVTPDARGEWSERVMMPLFASGRLRPAGEAMSHPRPVLAWTRP